MLWLLVLFGQLVGGVPHLSITSDEPSHVVAGLTYLKTGSLWVPPRHGHPPLLNVLCALPLLFQPDLPELSGLTGWQDDFSTFVRAVLPRLGPVERLAFATRMPVILMTVLLAALTYRWALELFGGLGAGIALSLLTFDPNLLAHAQLATTDLGVTLLGLTALYATWRAARNRHASRWRWILAAGLFLGLTLASKGSGFIYAPAMAAIMLWPRIPRWLAARRVTDLKPLLIEGAAVVAVALVVLWAVYGFQVGPLPGGTLPLPFPAHIGLLKTIFRDTDRIAFLRGSTRVGGWWWYFFYTTAVKTPLSLLGLALWSGIVWIRQGSCRWIATAPLLIFPGLYWLTAVTSGMNIGHRHLLPTFPLAYIFIAQLGAVRPSPPGAQHRWARVVQGGLLIGCAVEALMIFPFYLAYFNPLAGGPSQGYRHLADSNVAWGQSFIALRKYMSEADIPKVRLSYYTYTDPAAYGINYEPLPPAPGVSADVLTPYAPQPGFYAISATTLQGVMVAHRDLYEWFRHREPTAQPGYGLLVYEVKPEDVDWVAQCTRPVSPMPEEAIAEGMGSQPRMVAFDCTQTWPHPEGAGHYLIALDDELTTQPFVAQNLAQMSLIYEQRDAGRYPAFAFYRAAPPLQPTSDRVHIAPSAWPPAQALNEGIAAIPPLETEGPLTFLGGRFDPGPYQRGDTVELRTHWHVSASPELRNLSLMGHLLSEEGILVGNTDGLGVPLDQWRVGDRIVQYHPIRIPTETSPGRYYLQSGAYWLDTLERWDITQGGDRIVLGEIRVEP